MLYNFMYIIFLKRENYNNGEYISDCYMLEYIRVWGGCGYKRVVRRSFLGDYFDYWWL